MDAATEHILSVAAKGETDPDKMFSFADSPKVQRQVNAAIEDMVSQMQVTIEKGSRKELLQACHKKRCIPWVNYGHFEIVQKEIVAIPR